MSSFFWLWNQKIMTLNQNQMQQYHSYSLTPAVMLPLPAPRDLLKQMSLTMYFAKEKRSRSGESKLQHWQLLTKTLLLALKSFALKGIQSDLAPATICFFLFWSNEQFCSTRQQSDFRSKIVSQYLEVKSAPASQKETVSCVHRPVRHLFILEPNILFKNLIYCIFPEHLSYASAMLGVQLRYHPGYPHYRLSGIYNTSKIFSLLERDLSTLWSPQENFSPFFLVFWGFGEFFVLLWGFFLLIITFLP